MSRGERSIWTCDRSATSVSERQFDLSRPPSRAGLVVRVLLAIRLSNHRAAFRCLCATTLHSSLARRSCSVAPARSMGTESGRKGGSNRVRASVFETGGTLAPVSGRRLAAAGSMEIRFSALVQGRVRSRLPSRPASMRSVAHRLPAPASASASSQRAEQRTTTTRHDPWRRRLPRRGGGGTTMRLSWPPARAGEPSRTGQKPRLLHPVSIRVLLCSLLPLPEWTPADRACATTERTQTLECTSVRHSANKWPRWLTMPPRAGSTCRVKKARQGRSPRSSTGDRDDPDEHLASTSSAHF
jgi:hypothetical protein